MSYRLQLINSTRYLASSLAKLVHNLAEGIHKIKCTNCNMCCLEYANAKDNPIENKCLYCTKNYQKSPMKT